MFFVDPCLRVKTVCATDTHKQKNNLADGWQDLAGPSWQTIEGCINIKKNNNQKFNIYYFKFNRIHREERTKKLATRQRRNSRILNVIFNIFCTASAITIFLELCDYMWMSNVT